MFSRRDQRATIRASSAASSGIIGAPMCQRGDPAVVMASIEPSGRPGIIEHSRRGSYFSFAVGAKKSLSVERFHLYDIYLVITVAFCTYPMQRLGAASTWFQHKRVNSKSKMMQIVFLFLSFPCFKISHFFFMIAYTINQRRLRLLCGENFFLKFYDRGVSKGGVVNILQSLRNIECGLHGSEAAINLCNHGDRS